jgi:hypothetical protein
MLRSRTGYVTVSFEACREPGLTDTVAPQAINGWTSLVPMIVPNDGQEPVLAKNGTAVSTEISVIKRQWRRCTITAVQKAQNLLRCRQVRGINGGGHVRKSTRIDRFRVEYGMIQYKLMKSPSRTSVLDDMLNLSL